MISFERSDNSVAARWWWTVDRTLLVMVVIMGFLGMVLTLTASPAVAERINLDSLHFAKRQGFFLVMAMFTVVIISMLSDHTIRRFVLVGLLASVMLVIATLLFGTEVKGATRWISLGTFTLQPSEFLKPFFVVSTAFLFSFKFTDQRVPIFKSAVGVFAILAALLLLQPDLGQTLLIGMVLLAQMILAGLPLLWISVAGLVGLVGLGLAYIFLPHVARRIDIFLDPTNNDNYQAARAREAFENGGLFGTGPGEGVVKQHLPDAHTDYIFSVVGEEFGALAAVILLLLFAGFVIRGLGHLTTERDPFRLLAVAGLLVQFGLQVLINVGVNIGILPSKGMTLPFISYGGSSMLALAIAMGMVLALTRCNWFEKQQQARQDDQVFAGLSNPSSAIMFDAGSLDFKPKSNANLKVMPRQESSDDIFPA